MINSSVNQVIYQGNGSAKEFSYPFVIIDKSNIHLTLVDTDGSEKAITSDYYIETSESKVFYPGYAPGSEPPSYEQPLPLKKGQKLVIYRQVPITQLTDLSDVWPFNVIEKAFDKLTIICQQIASSFGRCLKVSEAYEGFDSTIPVQPNKAIEINADGTGFALADSPSEVRAECVAIRNQAESYKTQAGTYCQSAATSASSAAANAAIASSSSAQAGVYASIAQSNAAEAGAQAEVVESYYANVAEPFDIDAEYEAGDLVFVSNGDMYRALQDVSGVEPTVSTLWVKVQSNILTAFEMDAAGDLMPKINPSTSSIWDLDENGDVTPTAYGSGTETHGAEEQIIENQRNIAKNKYAIDGLAEIKADKSYVDTQDNLQKSDITQLKGNIVELERSNNLLWKLNKGQTYDFETDSTSAYTKQIKSGAVAMDLQSLGGKSVVVNQYFNTKSLVLDAIINYDTQTEKVAISGTASGTKYMSLAYAPYVTHLVPNTVIGHKYYVKINFIKNNNTLAEGSTNDIQIYNDGGGIIAERINSYKCYSTATKANPFFLRIQGGTVLDCEFKAMIIDVTQILGAGNEPTTVAEFEQMFPNDYYPYSSGEIVSADTQSVIVKNASGTVTKTITLPSTIPACKSAGSVYDTNEFYSVKQADGTYKYYCKHTQRIGQVDLGTLNWTLDARWAYKQFYSYVNYVKSSTKNLLTSIYTYSSIGWSVGNIGNMLMASGGNAIILVNDSYTDATTFSSAMSGVILYYELAEPIVTTIELSQNLFEDLDVESGGSITFVGNNANYHLPIPNSEEYLLKLDEVTTE